MKIILKIGKYDNLRNDDYFEKTVKFEFQNMTPKKPMAWVTKDDVRITWGGGARKMTSFFFKEIVNGKFCEEKNEEKKDP